MNSVKDLSLMTSFIIDGCMYETVMTALHYSADYVQFIFPFESPISMKFEIIGKDNTLLQSVNTGAMSSMPIGQSKMFNKNEFGSYITIRVYKVLPTQNQPNVLLDNLIIKTSRATGHRIVFYIVTNIYPQSIGYTH
ncbi:hypothetical protein PPL_06594 [Heterostelium album PN500]|uniref:Uncharacterized protein n=1 Tax=Heterostelium pallidum (strain ATCC 26659 / Pp 5 / PN500) TaxID=670386 RepID=D3BF61_HETP5|nr:hypothetical protein PPL_06594 [Heterostelium album PN500]EFA79775.1 hypothetical protein PPL_06594 [Heterostelium album PN500]|eukprot:XP_020431896.1 hypothetical protein PPL_06594 [Heterostelium album PN500]